jgi:hypothetical protein
MFRTSMLAREESRIFPGEPQVHWSGNHRAALTGQAIYPRPLQDPLPTGSVSASRPNLSLVRACLDFL